MGESSTFRRAETLLRESGRCPGENSRLARLIALFLDSPAPADPIGLYPNFDAHRERARSALAEGGGESLEDAFLLLYAHLHGHEAPYTADERHRVDRSGGYWCHAGGLSPVLKARSFVRPDTVSADFGAGNGLQGLLIQKLYPHRKTIQVEISGRMIESGRALQAWLGIDPNRVDWVHADLVDTQFPQPLPDFLYLYRPVRPIGPGRDFYERLAIALERADGPIVIFSIADCLRSFLSRRFAVVHSDGHLTCHERQ